MINKDNFHIISDEEKACYKLELCELCCFYSECELINDYIFKQIQKNASKSAAITKPMFVKNSVMKPTDIAKIQYTQVESCRSVADLPFYMRDVWENNVCPMKEFNQIECGGQWVSEGIGNDFKIDIEYDNKAEQFKIVSSSKKRNSMVNRWEPHQPVFISAQTGNGKNHFIENELLSYVRKLNYKNKTELKVLIISNRIALRLQIKDRLKTGVTEDDKIYYDYRKYADVMSYQSLSKKAEYLNRVQKKKDSNYIFVICDEIHYITSDAMFNPDTERDLEAIVNIFADAIRVYMTATPYESIKYIQEKESQRKKYIPGVLYHFIRDYRYLNTKYFSDESSELKDIIFNSVAHNNEKWLIFIDNKRHGAAFKNLLENNNGDPTFLKGKVLTISNESKDKDEKYQQMILNERFDKDISVVIATSVIDNGVNFRDIENVVITDINRTKCLQMVGRVRVGKGSGDKVNLYLKRHNYSYIARRLKSIGVQQDAYHSYDMAAGARSYKGEFLDKYYDNDADDWSNAKHWFGRDKKEPDILYPNEIARSLADKHGYVYESILKEMAEADSGRKVTGQKYLEYQLSWFGKKYSKKNDITLSGYKNDSQLGFEKWIKEEWLEKIISKEFQKDFGKKFYEKYNPIFGSCTKKQGFSSDDNRGDNGPKTAGYSTKRVKEIFQIMKMPFEIIEDDGCCVIKFKN